MHVDEFSVSIEHELQADLGIRATYVRKNLRNRWTDYNAVWANNLTVPYTTTCTGCPSGYEGQTLNLATIPDDLAGSTDVIWGQTPDDGDTYSTIQLAANRRMRGGLFFQGSFDYQWRDERRRATGDSSSPLSSDPVGKGFDIGYSTDVSYQQENTTWQAKFLARYDFAHEIGTSLNLRHQSGFPFAPIHRVSIPNVGTQPIFLDDLKNNRSDNVTILDFRIDKAFSLGGNYKATAMLDIANLLNSNPDTNFVMRTGSRYGNVIQWLPGRTFKIGLRFTF